MITFVRLEKSVFLFMFGLKNIIVFLGVVIFSLFTKRSDAQFVLGKYDTIKVEVTITDDGVKIPTGELIPIFLFAKLDPKMRKMYEQWTRLRNAVYVTYPYAKAGGRVINEINHELVGVTDKQKRKAIIKSHERELRTQFSDKIRNLSVYQGKVLMKLIYRETGSSCYEIIDEYKGDFNAIVYQGVAKVFGSSLKQTYDANGEDRSIELIVQQVQQYYGF